MSVLLVQHQPSLTTSNQTTLLGRNVVNTHVTYMTGLSQPHPVYATPSERPRPQRPQRSVQRPHDNASKDGGGSQEDGDAVSFGHGLETVRTLKCKLKTARNNGTTCTTRMNLIPNVRGINMETLLAPSCSTLSAATTPRW